ncbi:dTDP-4-dehydrorhamnose reductase [Azonexus fungiphilus]|uniref:dTDP-4-dehydrorhamnose reductase n=1 Tax=Azonexus fungiphilus TaxID=146940 RepID=UPI00156B3FC2|nr:dTDP-4-dehydrorhamnose reductase [Azonexus fungiphilus]NHC08146.1 dTDP-4-dehydrorhamnose reductase [Azonexus fungiphilus]
MKILLTGKYGQVGFELQRSLAPLGELVAVDHADCDLADPVAIRDLVRQVKPSVIVNPAAYTAVDKAESEPALAEAINAVAPGVLAEETDRLGALLVHYSTDYVFDGAMPGSYLETDGTNPQSVYGRTKRDGEVAVRAATERHLILRTSWVIGAHGCNFAKTMLRLAAERERLQVVADQWGAPTSAALLADLTAHLVRQWQRRGEAAFPYGTYHAVAGGETNWCDYARFVIGEAILVGRVMKVMPAAVQAITTADYPTPARRPANSRLDTTRLKSTFGLELPHWQQGVRHILQQIL